MGYIFSQNVEYYGKQPNFSRDQFNKVAEMKAFLENKLDEGHISYCLETGKTYQYKSGNTVDATLGKWREFASGGGSVTVKAPLVKNADGSIGLSYGDGLVLNADELVAQAGFGLEFDKDGGIKVKPEDATINVNNKGISVNYDPRGGLTTQGDGLGIDARGALIANENGLNLALGADSALAIESDGLNVAVSEGGGLGKEADGLYINLGPKSGLKSDKINGVSLQLGTTQRPYALGIGENGELQLLLADDGTPTGLRMDIGTGGLRIDTVTLGSILANDAETYRKCLGITSNGTINFQ